MKILSWNINGIRATKIKLGELFKSLDADIICIQETKVTRDQLDEPSAIVDGYNAYFSFSRGRAGYSGVATFCKDSSVPVAAEEGLTGLHASTAGNDTVGFYGDHSDFTDDSLQSLDNEGRCVITLHKFKDNSGAEMEVAVMNVYCPRYDPDDENRLKFKLNFHALLQRRSEALLKAGKHVIILGDINQSHKPIDHCEPDNKRFYAAVPGRQWLSQFLCELTEDGRPVTVQRDAYRSSESESDSPVKGLAQKKSGGKFIDTFRYFHPTQREAFTCWSVASSARQLNYGTRIDYIFADIYLCEEIFEDSITMPDFQGSDHCPVKATLKCTSIPARKCPSLCTKYMPEFAGKQQKLSAFFTATSKRTRESELGASSDPSPEKKSTQESKTQAEKGETKMGKGSLKRNNSKGKDSPAKRRKTAGDDKRKNLSIMNFFQKKSDSFSQSHKPGKVKPSQIGIDKTELPAGSSQRESVTAGTSSNTSDAEVTELSQQSCSSLESYDSSAFEDFGERKKSQAAKWKSVLTGPPPPPLCKGHKEPAVLKTVRKSGPNHGRQFYTCARPEGRKDDKEARCDFFHWVKKR